MKHTAQHSKASTSRRSFLRKGLAVGGAGAIGAGLLANGVPAFAEEESGGLTKGDAAILRFLAAIEIIETDLWQQYNELGGIQDGEVIDGEAVSGGSGSPGYTAALQVLDGDMPQYIHDNTEDEISHFTFINAYLMSKGAATVNLDQFRTLKGSQADGAQKDLKRLTNLMELTVDTSYWTRYRSRTGNPDFGDTFAQAIPGLFKNGTGQFPAIPRTNADLKGFIPGTPGTPPFIPDHLQAIANTAGFHFGFIEQGGTSLYPQLAQRVTHPEVLRILLSIGPTETMHFQVWHDKAGNAPALTDPTNGLVFPNLNTPQPGLTLEDTQTNLIMPEPTIFLRRTFPFVSIIRPTATEGAAMATLNAFIADGLFRGQNDPEFFTVLKGLAKAADAARHGG
jgi:hypothetical protein